MKLKVQTLDAKAKGDIDLNDEVFGVEPRADILHRVVTWQREKARGTARPTRERSEVARTGKKFGRQKGGGTARHGERRVAGVGDGVAQLALAAHGHVAERQVAADADDARGGRRRPAVSRAG